MRWLKEIMRYILVFSLLIILLWAQPLPVREGDEKGNGNDRGSGNGEAAAGADGAAGADEGIRRQDARLVYIFLTAAGVIVVTAYIATFRSIPRQKQGGERTQWPQLEIEDWDLKSGIASEDWTRDAEHYPYERGWNDNDADYGDYEYGYDEKYDYDITQAAQNPQGPAVISVQDVTMVFHISGSNASGIKEYLIQCLKRQVAFRELVALDHVSFNVFKGEVVGVIGTNGSGKSTLLRIVSGALSPTRGRVLADRKKVQLLTLGTGFDMELSARENVYLNGSIIGYSKKFLDEHYEEIVKFAELEGFMGEKVKNFSSGMVSRLGFAIATAGDAAEILILDEVLSVGDEFFRKKSLKRVKEMIHGGSTVLMVSHGMGTILENCTKVVWIEKGKLQMVGEPKVVCGAYQRMEKELPAAKNEAG